MSNKFPTQEEALKSWSDYTETLINERYAVRQGGVPIEHTYDEVIARVAAWITSKECLAKLPITLNAWLHTASSPGEQDVNILSRLERLLKDKIVVPATPVLMNGGAKTHRAGYFSCYPLGYVDDSLKGIMDCMKLMTEIYSRAGGCGVNISKIRKKGSLVDNDQGEASGPVSFLSMFNAVSAVISQGGRRRGALMGDISDQHPDILEFIQAKASGTHVLNDVNLSVDIEDEFDEVVLDAIAKKIWECGDPGLIFIKNAYANTPIPLELEPRFVNPCAEYMSVANTACNLVSVNLPEIAKHSKSSEEFFSKVAEASKYAIYFGTMLLYQKDGYPNEEIASRTMEYRPVGLGMMGLHGAMIRQGISYQSEEAIEFAGAVQAVIALSSMHASANMMKEEPQKVPCNVEWLKGFEERLIKKVDPEIIGYDSSLVRAILEKYGSLFNMVLTVQAPTGSISQLAQSASNGIEPLFAPVFTRRSKKVNEGWHQVTLCPLEIFDENGDPIISYEDLDKQTALKIPPTQQLRIMAAIQEGCQTAISKTVNVPEETTVEQIKELILEAFHTYKLKSMTIYRDGSKSEQVLSTVKKEEKKKKSDSLPSMMNARTHHITGSKSGFVIIARDEEDVPKEVFIISGKSGSTLGARNEALGRVLSLALQKAPEIVHAFIETLDGIDAGHILAYPGKRARSMPDMVSHILKLEIDQTGSKTSFSDSKTDSPYDACPECGQFELMRSGGCKSCKNCGYSSC